MERWKEKAEWIFPSRRKTVLHLPVRHLPSPSRSPPAVPTGMPERWILRAIVMGRRWKQRPRPLLSPEQGSDKLTNSRARPLRGSGRTLPQTPFSLLLGFFSHFLSRIFYHVVNYSSSRTPPSLTPRHVPHASSPIPLFWDASWKDWQRKRERERNGVRERERKYFESCGWCSFTGGPSLSLAFDLYRKNFPDKKKLTDSYGSGFFSTTQT